MKDYKNAKPGDIYRAIDNPSAPYIKGWVFKLIQDVSKKSPSSSIRFKAILLIGPSHKIGQLIYPAISETDNYEKV